MDLAVSIRQVVVLATAIAGKRFHLSRRQQLGAGGVLALQASVAGAAKSRSRAGNQERVGWQS